MRYLLWALITTFLSSTLATAQGVIKALPTAFPADDSLVYEAPGPIYFKSFKSSRSYEAGLNIFHVNERLVSPSEEFNAALYLTGRVAIFRNPNFSDPAKKRDHTGAYLHHVVRNLGPDGSYEYITSPITYLIVTKGCNFDIGQRVDGKELFIERFLYRPGIYTGYPTAPGDCYMTLANDGLIEIHWGKDPSDDQALVGVLGDPKTDRQGQCFCLNADTQCKAPVIAKPTTLTCGKAACRALCRHSCVDYRNGHGPSCGF